ncbi:substrate-binding domain-containing protein [Turicibacter sanguinis]|uniref:substrate-binding domain-containing protein n=1 Tax=Turicibacter sanguinis TaxID=154288 RepID=UPI0021D4D7E2|nr:substrate-binding domain-containing protein [Turicibacter sanguinis]MCU7192223.1 substrate-binding domain-containing protein [Turicibacter sanguinis]
MKKLMSIMAAAALTFSLAACGSKTETSEQPQTSTEGSNTETTSLGVIDVVSREEGSGTRSAFEEIIGFNVDGEDPMTSNATIKDGNGVVATYVAGNESAIGYVSFVTLEEKASELKGLTVDGVEPTAANVLEGTYGVSRPFMMVYKDENLTDVERAFIDFLASKDGLEVLESTGTIVDTANAEDFDMSKYDNLTGNMTLGGSTSTEKAVKAAADEFTALFPKVTYTYDGTGSGTGVNNAQDGTYTLGFASRELKESEIESGLAYSTLCMDGIAVVVNKENSTNDITLEQIREVYTGKITDWNEVK